MTFQFSYGNRDHIHDQIQDGEPEVDLPISVFTWLVEYVDLSLHSWKVCLPSNHVSYMTAIFQIYTP